GGGKAEQIYLRGVDNDHGTDFNISVDGMPVNMVSHAHGQGYADLHFLIPEIIDHIEFNKGTYYAKKGNFTTTGYADFKTKNKLDNSVLKLEAGNFNTQRLMTAFNLYNNEKTHQNIYLAGEFLYSDAYFETPQLFKRFNLFAKYNGKVAEGTYLSVSASTFSSNWNHSGQIPDRAVRRGWITRFGAIDDSEGGFTGRTNLNAQLSTRLNDHIQINNQLYVSKYDFQLWSNFTFFLNDTTNGDQIMQKENRILYGYNGSVSIFSKLGSKDLKSDFGIGVRYDDIQGDQLLHTFKRNTVLDTFSIGDVNESNLFAYYSGDIYLSSQFLINLGLRYDYFIFQYTDNTQKEFSPYHKNSGIFSPKLSFYFNPNSNLQFYLKTGYGFHSNDTRLIALQQVDKDLPYAISGDLGSFFKLFDKIVMNVAVWTMYMEQEFVYVGDEAVVEPKGETMRYGVDVSVRYQLSKHLFFDADYNYSYGYFIDLPDNENYIPLAPIHTSMGGLTYKSAKGLNASLRYRYVSDRPANEDNSVVALGYFLTEAAASYKWNHLEIFARADNLFNVEWNEAQFDTESRLRYPDANGNFTGNLEPASVSELHYTPGYPFSFRAGMIFKF
ncbi:MAG: TonB-dependent receptor plug domain-containing protein, partial [Bacteroidales bacterium]|nr:TonB-dependent receptor plug domain-containing protein [Bacteroidales bacterium]